MRLSSCCCTIINVCGLEQSTTCFLTLHTLYISSCLVTKKWKCFLCGLHLCLTLSMQRNNDWSLTEVSHYTAIYASWENFKSFTLMIIYYYSWSPLPASFKRRCHTSPDSQKRQPHYWIHREINGVGFHINLLGNMSTKAEQVLHVSSVLPLATTVRPMRKYLQFNFALSFISIKYQPLGHCMWWGMSFCSDSLLLVSDTC